MKTVDQDAQKPPAATPRNPGTTSKFQTTCWPPRLHRCATASARSGQSWPRLLWGPALLQIPPPDNWLPPTRPL